MARLTNPRHEAFAQHVAAGQPKYKAYGLAYGRPLQSETLRANGSRLWLHLEASPKIRQRTYELMAERRKAADLTYDALLDDVMLTIDLARESNQHAVALKGQQLLGSEMFQAFADRRETVNIDIKVNNKAELKALLIRDYGEPLADEIWAHWSKPKLIEHNASDAASLDNEAERGEVDNSAKTAKDALQSI